MAVTFRCLGCGNCCRNLIEMHGSVRLGMMLLPEERSLFPRYMVHPLYQAGGVAIAYQYVGKDCPHLTNEGCAIYDNRPLICRSFPVGEIKRKEEEVSCYFTRCAFISYVAPLIERGMLEVSYPQFMTEAHQAVLALVEQAEGIYDSKRQRWLSRHEFLNVVLTGRC